MICFSEFSNNDGNRGDRHDDTQPEGQKTRPWAEVAGVGQIQPGQNDGGNSQKKKADTGNDVGIPHLDSSRSSHPLIFLSGPKGGGLTYIPI